MNTLTGIAAASVAALAIGGRIEPARAQQEGRPVTVEVSQCLEIESPEERLACFEKSVDTAIQQGSAPPAPAPAPAPATATAPAPTPEAPTPATATAPTPATATAPAPAAATAPAPASASDYPPIAGSQRAAPAESRPDIVSTIVELRETVPNAYMITLANGQVWRQMRPKIYRLRVGHAVRIYPTHWGSSFRLTVEELRSYIQVERVQ